MDKNIEIGMLLDFYGQLLTDRQQEILNLYFENDLSLAEISEDLGITRQGVHDNIKRAEKSLYEYEERLGIVNKFMQNKIKIGNALKHIDLAQKKAEDTEINGHLGTVKEILNQIIDD